MHYVSSKGSRQFCTNNNKKTKPNNSLEKEIEYESKGEMLESE